MKKTLSAVVIILIAASCHVNMSKTIKGNGRMTSEERSVSDLSRIKIRGGINVEVVPGVSLLKVEADENLLRYIETKEENGWIIIKTKDNFNLRSNHPIRVFISTDVISAVNIAGSGSLKGDGKFDGAGALDIDIAGSGDVTLAVNTPKVNVDIRGSGSVTLSGETRNASVDIAGSGNYMAENLLTESTDIDIKGSGDAKVHADNTLDANLLGSGSVYYRGKANVHTNTAGSGRVRPME
jgi:hypothetical protein